MSTLGCDDQKVPARLRAGDRIGIVAPAGPYDQNAFERGIKVVEEMGFEIFVPPNLLDAGGYFAGSDHHRAQFLNLLFADESVQAIICARGGYGSMRIMHLLDYQTIAKNPKIFIGFSDITGLLSVFGNHCGLVTFHGPVVTSLADAQAETRESLMRAVSSAAELELKVPDGIAVKAGTGSGIVCGGNLTTLCHLVGTPYAPQFTDKIVFLEDRAEAPYRIDRMLVHMQLAGCFENLAGIALGSFEKCGPIEDIYNIFGELFNHDQIPILAGFDVGHGEINLTLPLGIEATLDANRHLLSYHRAATVLR